MSNSNIGEGERQELGIEPYAELLKQATILDLERSLAEMRFDLQFLTDQLAAIPSGIDSRLAIERGKRIVARLLGKVIATEEELRSRTEVS